MSQVVVLLENEPLGAILQKWLGWIIVMVIFVMIVINLSHYFSRYNECYIKQDLQPRLTFQR